MTAADSKIKSERDVNIKRSRAAFRGELGSDHKAAS